jgi:hypothetical protein
MPIKVYTANWSMKLNFSENLPINKMGYVPQKEAM